TGVAGRSGTGGSASTGGTTGSGGATGAGGTPASGKSGLPVPPGASNVPQPSGSPGTVTVLNWAGFKAAASYTFDDDNSSQISAYSQLQALGVPYTFYIFGNKTDASNSIWAQAVKDGHEIGNHSWSHQSVPPGGVADLTMDTTFIMQHMNVAPYTMAAPNGASVYTQLANGLFVINRGVADAIIKPNDNSDRFTLPCYIPPTGGTASANFNPEIDAAHTAGGWRVVLVHGFTGGTDGAYQPVPLTEFITAVKHTISLGDMWIGRVVDVGAYWLGQKAFSAATKTMSGTSTTYTWTLPSNFPPGKYLRVTVSGGTVTQGGAALAWDPHGYYEVALDAKSLTVGP
ncbi:MAG: polysaccharide deacetylase family protein, partial [Pseudomonadota bacterium]